MALKNMIPNFITCLNLLCGCIGIVLCFTGHITGGSWMILLAAVFDFSDGFAARMLKAQSAIGKDLDSLADVITFGLLPSIVMMQLFITVNPFMHTNAGLPFPQMLLPWAPLLLAVFSALRLAKFNNDTRQTNSFIGLPTPANAMAIAAFPTLVQNYLVNNTTGNSSLMENSIYQLFLHPTFYILFIIFMSCLLVAEIPLFSLKFKNFTLRDNLFPYILIAAAVLLFIFFKIGALPLVIILYVLLSVIKNSVATSK